MSETTESETHEVPPATESGTRAAQSARHAAHAIPAAEAAATVVLTRESDRGLEVLLLQRPARGSFANAWVFPGGKVDAADAPGAPRDARSRAAAVREAREETGVTLDADALVPLSRWVPPTHIPRRFDTDFFLASVSGDDIELVLSPDEVVAARWLRPDEALALHAEAALTLAPPTWVTLSDLAEHESLEAVHIALAGNGPSTFETRGDPTTGLVTWQADESYDGAPETETGPRHRLYCAALPWRYERR